YFVMRYMTGGSLSGWIEKGKFSVQDTARIIEKIAQGLAYSHKKGIVHRDLKPDNILFDNNDDPFISDFGVAKLTEASGGLTGSGTIGTPAYMSPEQAQGGSEIDGRSDVYGLGVIIYQMLSGRQPYSADTPMGVVVKHITEPVPEILKVLPDLPPEMDTIIKTSMAKDKTKRYATTVDLAKALNLLAFGNEGNLTFNTGLRSGLYTAPTQPSRGITGLVVTGIVLLVAVIGFFLLRNQLFTTPEQPTSTPPALTSTTAPTIDPTLTVAPTLQAVEPSPIPFAAFCTADLIPALPEVKLTQSVCVSKRPYVSITIPEGASFETLNPAASCESEATSNGKDVLSCGGPSFLVFDLKVCTPPVVANADLDKCSQDATFDSTNQCCVPAPPEGPGCVLFEVKLKGC
ncbi:MAG: serine/threonine-protein kinase, partial [Ferruginibacter sp.]